MNAPVRLHALDNLRAAMMWLGIVLHVAVIHVVGPSPLPWRDDRTTQLADLLMALIHTFRMPVFFVLGGFFVAMLAERRGERAMLRHRLRRLALPFALFWPPIFIAIAVFATLFVHRMMRAGAWGFDPALVPWRPDVPRINTMHLWFLYLLLWFSVLTAAAGLVRERLPARVRDALVDAFARLGSRWWGVPALALPLALAGASYPFGIVVPSGSFMPPWPEWLHNGVFYVFGLALYRLREPLLERFRRRTVALGLAGLGCFLASGPLVAVAQADPAAGAALAPLVAFVYGAASWAWSFALIGVFLNRLASRHRVLQYLSDSSYWVYLVHLPCTVAFGALMYGAPLPAAVKMLANIVATTLVCVASYHLFVRRRWIGRLLNGDRAAAASAPPYANVGAPPDPA